MFPKNMVQPTEIQKYILDDIAQISNSLEDLIIKIGSLNPGDTEVNYSSCRSSDFAFFFFENSSAFLRKHPFNGSNDFTKKVLLKIAIDLGVDCHDVFNNNFKVDFSSLKDDASINI